MNAQTSIPSAPIPPRRRRRLIVAAAIAVVLTVSGLRVGWNDSLDARFATASAATGAKARPDPKRAPAAARTAPRKPVQLHWKSQVAGIALDLRGSGWALRDEQHPDAEPHQLVEAAEVMRDGDVLVRLDVFANPNHETAADWLDGDQRPLALGAKDVRPIAAPASAPRDTTAVRLRFEHASQSQARILALIATPSHRLRLTCEDAEDPDAVRAFTAALAGLSWPKAASARGGR